MTPFDKMRADLGLVESTNDGSRIGNQRLKQYLDQRRIGYNTGLDILQAHGVISDLVEYIEDIYGPDQVRAIKWMDYNVGRDKYGRLKIKGNNERA